MNDLQITLAAIYVSLIFIFFLYSLVCLILSALDDDK